VALKHNVSGPPWGPELAVIMIVSGEPLSAAEALKSGLIDEIIGGSSTTAGETFCAHDLAGKIPMRRLRDDDTKLLAASNDRTIFTNAVAAGTKRNRGFTTPLPPAETVGRSPDVPFEEALTRESNAFLKLSPS
jgi:3-hydroxyacyl-CoA dehydrogenase